MLFTCALPAMAQDMPLSQVLIDGEGWRIVKNKYLKNKNLTYYAVQDDKRIGGAGITAYHSRGFDRILPSGEVERFESQPMKDFRQYIFGMSETRSFYTTDAEKGTIQIHPTITDGRGITSIWPSGLSGPRGIAVSPDGWTLYVGNAEGKYVWAFRIEENGRLSAGQPYGLLRTRPKQPSDVISLETDTAGRIYATTLLGVQILDPTGRLCGVLTNPTNEPLVGIAFGGPDGHSLYLASKTAIYVRKVKSQGLGFAKAK